MNILPSPDYKINTQTGETSVYTGDALASYEKLGPGFASVKLSSEFNTMSDRTNSGVYLSRSISYHKWSIDIGYNPMTREEFEPVYTFLMKNKGGLKPFYVNLPQYATSQNMGEGLTFGGETGTTLTVNQETDARSDTLSFDASSNLPRPGDMFNIVDDSDAKHYKAYIVNFVNSNSISFTPELQKRVNDDAVLQFYRPLIRVVATDMQEYSLNTNNLYSFSLKLEEAL